MKYKYLFHFMALFTFIKIVSIMDNYYFMYHWYAKNINKVFNIFFPMGILEIIILLVCFIGGIKKIKWTPFVSIAFIKFWLISSINMLDNYFFNPPAGMITVRKWTKSFYINNVFFLNWLDAIATLLLPLLCLTLMLLIIKDKITKQE